MTRLQLLAVIFAAMLGAFGGALLLQSTQAQTIGNGPANVIYLASPSPSTSPQPGNAWINGQMAAGLLVLPSPSTHPSPSVSQSPIIYFAMSSTGGLNFNNDTDAGQSGHNLVNFAANNQGVSGTVYAFNENGVATISGGGAISSAGLPTPAAPTPTCSPGGANGSTQYWVKTNMVSMSDNTHLSASSPEATLTCAANTFLQVNAPTAVAGASGWSVSATTAGTGLEAIQTQGTSPADGRNIPFTTAAWVSTATLAGAVSAPSQDNSQHAWQQTTSSGTVLASIIGASTSFVAGPLEASACAQTGTATPCPKSFTPPVYKHDGTASASTMHCVGGGGDSVTAAGVSTTVTLTAPATFASANYPLMVWDDTGLGFATVTAQATGSFTFTSVNTRVYTYWACGS